MEPGTTVAFHRVLAMTEENKAEVQALVENQTGLPAWRVNIIENPPKVRLWGYVNTRGGLFFVEPAQT